MRTQQRGNECQGSRHRGSSRDSAVAPVAPVRAVGGDASRLGTRPAGDTQPGDRAAPWSCPRGAGAGGGAARAPHVLLPLLLPLLCAPTRSRLKPMRDAWSTSPAIPPDPVGCGSIRSPRNSLALPCCAPAWMWPQLCTPLASSSPNVLVASWGKCWNKPPEWALAGRAPVWEPPCPPRPRDGHRAVGTQEAARGSPSPQHPSSPRSKPPHDEQ